VLLDEADEDTTEGWYEREYDPERFDGNVYRTFRNDRMSGVRTVTGYHPNR